MRRVGLAVTVEAHPDGRPGAVVYRHRRLVLRWLKRWRSKGRWFLGEGPRAYWWVEVEGGLTLEVYHQEGSGLWVLTRILD